jgi:hypothetical protein
MAGPAWIVHGSRIRENSADAPSEFSRIRLPRFGLAGVIFDRGPEKAEAVFANFASFSAGQAMAAPSTCSMHDAEVRWPEQIVPVGRTVPLAVWPSARTGV